MFVVRKSKKDPKKKIFFDSFLCFRFSAGPMQKAVQGQADLLERKNCETFLNKKTLFYWTKTFRTYFTTKKSHFLTKKFNGNLKYLLYSSIFVFEKMKKNLDRRSFEPACLIINWTLSILHFQELDTSFSGTWLAL